MVTYPRLRNVRALTMELARRSVPTGRFWDDTLSFLSAWNRLGYMPRIDVPRSYNEHILNQKKHFARNIELARKLTDKYELKEWLSEVGYRNLAISTLNVFTDAQQLQDTQLRGNTMLKPTHLSGRAIPIHFQRTLTRTELSNAGRWLKSDHYRKKREPTYKDLRKRLILEPLLLDEDGNIPMDYKIHCFHGYPFMIQVDLDRFTDHTQQLYSINWELLDFGIRIPRNPIPIPEPDQLRSALEVAADLSGRFLFCRVDFYLLSNGEKRIGEITFFPHSGEGEFSPKDADFKLGAEMQRLASRHTEDSQK